MQDRKVASKPTRAVRAVWEFALACSPVDPPPASPEEKAWSKAIKDFQGIVDDLRRAGLPVEAQFAASSVDSLKNKFNKPAKWHPLDGELQKLLNPTLVGAGAVSEFILHFGLLCGLKVLKLTELTSIPDRYLRAAVQPFWAKKFMEGVDREGASEIWLALKACLRAEKWDVDTLNTVLMPVVEVLFEFRHDSIRIVVEPNYFKNVTGQREKKQQAPPKRSIWEESKLLPTEEPPAPIGIVKHELKDTRSCFKGALERFKKCLG